MVQLESDIFDFTPIKNEPTEVFDFDPVAHIIFTRSAILPELDGENRELVLKLNAVLRTRHDGVSLSACLTSHAWIQMEEGLTKMERINTSRAINALIRSGVKTLGDVRKLGYREMMCFRNVGPRMAAIIMYSIQPGEALSIP